MFSELFTYQAPKQLGYCRHPSTDLKNGKLTAQKAWQIMHKNCALSAKQISSSLEARTLFIALRILITLVTCNKPCGQCWGSMIHPFKTSMFIIFSPNHMPSALNLLFFSPPHPGVTPTAFIPLTFLSYPQTAEGAEIKANYPFQETTHNIRRWTEL